MIRLTERIIIDPEGLPLESRSLKGRASLSTWS
jgi:hypothetical protein